MVSPGANQIRGICGRVGSAAAEKGARKTDDRRPTKGKVVHCSGMYSTLKSGGNCRLICCLLFPRHRIGRADPT